MGEARRATEHCEEHGTEALSLEDRRPFRAESQGQGAQQEEGWLKELAGKWRGDLLHWGSQSTADEGQWRVRGGGESLRLSPGLKKQDVVKLACLC